MIVLFLAALTYSNARAQEKSICWEEGVTLEWNDFQGEPDSLIVYTGTPALAGAVVPIRYRLVQLDTLIQLNVKVEFLKARSWTSDTSSVLLGHEQLHFDISELYARRIRKYFEELIKDKIKDSTPIKKNIDDLISESLEMQAQYDKETGHSVVDFMQAEWNERISNEMESLSKYASTKEDCKCFD